jgi:translation initiation factor 2 subunit 1
MLKKEGFPEENEIVICTITKIQHHSVFCNLDEYDKTGMLHISEISSGRIRNLNEYVKEGKTIICKVLQINKEKGYIDLSLRRVTEAQKKAKAASLKKYQFAMKILETASHETKIKPEDMYKELESKLKGYDEVFDLLQAVVEKNEQIPLAKPAADILTKVITDKLKPVSVTIKGQLELVTYDPNGVQLIHEAFSKVPDLNANYLGGGKYGIQITAKDYKKAEAQLKGDLESLEKTISKRATKFEFERTDR